MYYFDFIPFPRYSIPLGINVERKENGKLEREEKWDGEVVLPNDWCVNNGALE